MESRTVPVTLPPARTVPWQAGWDWAINGLRLWRRAPFMLFLLLLIEMVVEILVQLLPGAGMVLSKILVPVLGVGILVGVDRLARGDGLHLSTLVQGFRSERWAMLPMIVASSLAVFGVQVAIVSLIYGPGATDFVLMGHKHPELATSAFAMVVILPGVVPQMLLGLVAPLMIFHGVAPWQAVRLSISRVASAWRACLLFIAIDTIAFAIPLSSEWLNLLLLVVLPWDFAAGYTFYRDVITGDVVPDLATANQASGSTEI